MWSGNYIVVPFSTRENGHKGEALFYTHRRNALAQVLELQGSWVSAVFGKY
jgi:hypothetical protein